MQETPSRISVLVADDHTIVRRGLVSLLSLAEGIEVVGEAADGLSAFSLAMELDPDVVLMDISMPVLNGLEATRKIRKQNPSIRVLILSAHDSDDLIVQTIRSGAQGYVLKNVSSEELFTAIRSVHTGHAFFSPSVSRVLLDKYLARTPDTAAQGDDEQHPATRLTGREREILQLIAEGNTHQKIGHLLHISVRTVDTHANNIMKKLDIHDSAGLVTYAIKHGIVILPQ
jgi:two-component system nitrate/nitrite response regulator NarL